MSLILEALKKSESQRRLGEMPNLATPVIATRRPRSLLPVLAALIAVALAAGWWLQRGDAPAPAQVAAPAPPPGGERRAALADASKPATAPPRTPRAAEATKPAPPAGTVAEATPPAQPAAAAVPPPAPAAAPVPANPTAAAPAVANPATQPAAAPPLVAPAPAPPPAATATEPALPKLWELPYATRRELPAMQLTMQVYSDDPAKRFVILNDVRQAEGAELGKGLYLREIRQDGLVMEVDGTRFFYPRGGR